VYIQGDVNSAQNPTVEHRSGLRLLLLVFIASLACNSAAPDGSQQSSSNDRTMDIERTVPLDNNDQDTCDLIVFLGDSVTFGLGLPPHDAYPSIIQELIDAAGYGYKVHNASVSGDTTAGGLRRLSWVLDGDIHADDIHVLVIALGANDGLRGLSIVQMQENLSGIIEQAQSKDILVLLTGMEAPPNLGSLYANDFRVVFRDLADEYDVTLLPFLLEGVAGNVELNQADGIHPNTKGAQMIAEMVWLTLKPMLRMDSSR
jgi:acyl-CoA thioesterase-1|tara:strand:- start:851 stop:1627 length:777 start_codon:yes stop_codon:yes gene_type:complete